MRHITIRQGFSLIEVLAVLLILSVGFASAIGLLGYGLRLSRTAQLQAVAYPTALTLIADKSPAIPDPSRWTGVSANKWQGYVNGVWATRRVIDASTLNGLTFATIIVDIYDANGGEILLSLKERISFHAP